LVLTADVCEQQARRRCLQNQSVQRSSSFRS
jgi:hypothetical protein